MIVTQDTPYRSTMDCDPIVWNTAITSVGGPEDFASYFTHRRAAPHSALILALSWTESEHATKKNRNDPVLNKNPWSARLILPNGQYADDSTPAGYMSFMNYGFGCQHMIDRIITGKFWGSRAMRDPYADAYTIREFVSVYAPEKDGNDEEEITRKLVYLLNNYLNTEMEEPNMTRILKGTEDILVKVSTNWSGPNRPGTKLAEGDVYLIEHDTGNSNPGAGPYSHETFVIRDHGGSDNVSFHTTSGIENGRRVVVQLLPFDEIGWHAADGCNDGPNVDWGCKRGLANEMCVNRDIDVWESYKLAADVAAMLIYKDSRFDWTGFGNRQLSTSRIKSHQQASAQAWGGAGKYCSNYMLRNGLFPNDFIGRAEKRLEGATPTPQPTEPALEVYAPGLDEGIAAWLFGEVEGYHFDKRGPISRRWLARGLATRQFPRLVDFQSYEDGKRRYFVFSDGWTVLVANGEFIELGA